MIYNHFKCVSGRPETIPLPFIALPFRSFVHSVSIPEWRMRRMNNFAQSIRAERSNVKHGPVKYANRNEIETLSHSNAIRFSKLSTSFVLWIDVSQPIKWYKGIYNCCCCHCYYTSVRQVNKMNKNEVKWLEQMFAKNNSNFHEWFWRAWELLFTRSRVWNHMEQSMEHLKITFVFISRLNCINFLPFRCLSLFFISHNHLSTTEQLCRHKEYWTNAGI